MTEQEYERLWRSRLTREMIVVIVCLMLCVLSFLVGFKYGEGVGYQRGMLDLRDEVLKGVEEKERKEKGLRWY